MAENKNILGWIILGIIITLFLINSNIKTPTFNVFNLDLCTSTGGNVKSIDGVCRSNPYEGMNLTKCYEGSIICECPIGKNYNAQIGCTETRIICVEYVPPICKANEERVQAIVNGCSLSGCVPKDGFDFSSIPIWVWIGGGLVILYLLFRGKK